MHRKKVTLKSIAADLGITHTSVSNAFNNPVKVSKELRSKIISYAKSVNYHGPNPAARSLRTGLCGSIGIIFNDQLSYAFSDPHDMEFLRGVSTVCEEHGTNIVLIPLKNSNVNGFETLSAIVDGYILNAPYKSNTATQRALSKGLPTVVVDFDAPQHISILTNDAQMMSEMCEHLLSLGHRKIGIITFPLKERGQDLYTLDRDLVIDNYVVKQRLQGCKTAISKSNINLNSILVRETTNSEEGGAQAARHLLELQPAITALICFSDTLAYGAISECQNRGLDVPHKISVTGYDDVMPHKPHPKTPLLTTVRQDAFAKGRKAAEALLHKDQPPGKKVNIKAQIVVRNSTAKIRGL